MIILQSFKGKKIAIFGLGASNLSAAKALLAGGAQVIAFDDDEKSCQRAKELGIYVQDLRVIAWQEIDALVLTPAVPLHYPAPHWSVALARAHNVEVIGDIELFLRERAHFLAQKKLSPLECSFIAITGTNGKSTTTNLTAFLLQKAGYTTEIGGNIGIPILDLQPFEKGRHYVIECSSFQIDLTPSFSPTIGILLNITPDHIERHKDFFSYQQVKEQVIAKANYAILAIDDLPTCQIYKKLKNQKISKKSDDIKESRQLILVSKSKELDIGYYARGDKLYFKEKAQTELLVDLDNILALRGSHNAQNTLCALAALRIFTKDFSAQKALEAYISLPHRMEYIGQKDKILFINDSKATNAEASAAALEAFEDIYWILGGVAKEGGIEILKPFFAKIRKAYLIGQSQDDFAKTLEDGVLYSMEKNLENAVNHAFKDAEGDRQNSSPNHREEKVILLSPAAASYDQFPHYRARGEKFAACVKALLEKL